MFSPSKDIIREAITQLLNLGVNYRLHRFVLNKGRDDWRGLEAELHANYPVKGIGVRATRQNITGNDFLHKDELLAPEEITHFLSSSLFDAAMSSYAFTILEIAGDELVKVRKPDEDEGKAWHLSFKQDHDMTHGTASGLKIRFAKVFAADAEEVSTDAIIRLANIKAKRNEFAHQGETRVDFFDFLTDTLAVLCHLYFLCHDDVERLDLYPFETDHPKWAPNNGDWD
ncbi:hypothetical protein [Rhizobium leguminosarum]|uniref:hypothetical protein n=1 Tax=Rhizobium leguminosarum TaxID=384 RepID=UPI00143F9A44|nr:hypothetical protein [Rhizobium leguminosarum]NKL23652.1 hypothetical protein [Rhizobium leguminosarum bv. viciae]